MKDHGRGEPVLKRSRELKTLKIRLAHLEGLLSAHQVLILGVAAVLDDDAARKRVRLACMKMLGEPKKSNGRTKEENEARDNGFALGLTALVDGVKGPRPVKPSE